jgi:outer membrane receptor for ferric coprogen and ferric-rhodotorulic acid
MNRLYDQGRRRPTPRRHLLAIAVLTAGIGAAALSPLASAQSAAATTERVIDIPAQPLAQALSRFTALTGVQVVVPQGLPDGARSSAVDGTHAPAAALSKLLAGSGLTWRFVNDTTVSLDAAPTGDADVPVTDALRVVGAGVSSDAASSEGSGSYGAKRAATSTKLGLSLRETPQSVTVITRERLDDMGLFAVSDIMSQVAGVFVQYTDSERVNYNSRGYSISNISVDGMLNGGDGYLKANGDAAVYDRIEVVRGSTGLVTGAGDPSGTINLIRKRPTDAFAASAALTYGRWNNRRIEADVGGPLGWDGRLRGRVVAVRQASDDYRDNYSRDKEVFYGIVEADLTDTTLLTAGYDYQSPDSSGASWGTVPYWMSDGTLANLPRSTNLSARWSAWPRIEKQAFARIEQTFGDWTAKLAYTHNDSETNGFMYYGGAGYPNADGTGVTAWTSHFEGYTTMKAWEFNLNGTVDLFGRTHELIGGYVNQRQTGRTPASEDVLPAGYTSWTDYTTIRDWRHWDGNIPIFGSRPLGFDSATSNQEQDAWFAAARVNLADAWKAVVGARYSRYERGSRNYADDGSLDSASTLKIDDIVTPYAGLLFDVSENFTAYASYADIFKAQDYKDKNNRYLDPIEGGSYELGLKGEFLDGRLNASAAAFRSEQDNLAEIDDSVPPIIVDGQPQYAYRSSGKGNKVEGWELEVQGSLTDDWNIAAGYTHAKSENAAGVRINTNQPVDLLRLTTSWRLPGAWNALRIGGGVTWQSGISSTAAKPTGAYNPNGTPVTQRGVLVRQPGFALVNLSASYRFNDHVSAGVTVNNALDKSYYSRMGFYNGVYWGEPRNWSLNVRYAF